MLEVADINNGQIYENLLRKMKFVLKSIMCDP